MPGSPTPNACATRTGDYAYRTDGTTQAKSSVREPTNSGKRPSPSHHCEGHPWLGHAWRAGCGETRTSGSEWGMKKPALATGQGASSLLYLCPKGPLALGCRLRRSADSQFAHISSGARVSLACRAAVLSDASACVRELSTRGLKPPAASVHDSPLAPGAGSPMRRLAALFTALCALIIVAFAEIEAS